MDVGSGVFGVTGDESGAGEGLVEGQLEMELGALDGSDAAGVFDAAMGEGGVIGELKIHVGALELGIFEDGDGVGRGGLAVAVVDAVAGVLGDVGDGRTENGIGETAGEGKAAFGGGVEAEDDFGGSGWGIRELNEDNEGLAAFEFGITGRHGDTGSGTEE